MGCSDVANQPRFSTRSDSFGGRRTSHKVDEVVVLFYSLFCDTLLVWDTLLVSTNATLCSLNNRLCSRRGSGLGEGKSQRGMNWRGLVLPLALCLLRSNTYIRYTYKCSCSVRKFKKARRSHGERRNSLQAKRACVARIARKPKKGMPQDVSEDDQRTSCRAPCLRGAMLRVRSAKAWDATISMHSALEHARSRSRPGRHPAAPTKRCPHSPRGLSNGLAVSVPNNALALPDRSGSLAF